HAQKFIDIQCQQFQRLGILGDWDNPYRTMAPEYEASTLEVFAKFVEHGLVYKQLKPVAWSIENRTALADAELEYADRTDPSVYVEFAVANPGAVKGQFELRDPASVSLMIWTTTPWTLPANLAIAAGPSVEYAFVRFGDEAKGRITILAAELVAKVFGDREHTVLKTVPGDALVGMEYRHPFVERTGKVWAADYVTTTEGTGLVHTAPGHGEEDYGLGRAAGLDVYCPVQPNGRFDSTAPNFLTGLSVWEANDVIIDKLDELAVLFKKTDYPHSYPHDWRSKTPIIYRAADQWFIALDKPYTVGGKTATLRERALETLDSVKFYPDWGKARLRGMLENRPDWCVSRQRAWGLPIPVFYGEDGKPLLTVDSVKAVSRSFAERGSDAWFTDEPKQLLGGSFRYPPGFAAETLTKETDIFDVWFESGSSWRRVLGDNNDLRWPADLYLEGSDQHRGWFQLSMLCCLGAFGMPPFDAVLTHGFIVKPDGTKVSKSDKEYVTATQEIDRHGADLLRLWTCSIDYQGDMPTSPKVLAEFGDRYRKIRNTLRFLLGNTSDFDPAADAVDVPPDSLDGWFAWKIDELIRNVTAAYDDYKTHRAFALLYDFCNVTVSTIYGNAMKDRLYCEAPGSSLRRRCQTVLRRALEAVTTLLAPMAIYTADEVWEFTPHTPDGQWSVHLAVLPKASGAAEHPAWPTLFDLRDDALRQLEKLKADAGLNKATDAEVRYTLTADTRRLLEPFGVDLADLVAAGSHSIIDGDNDAVGVVDRREDYGLCARSRKRTADVGSNPDHLDLSARDAAVMKELA
ncbi:MAG: isoleucine--tRNA ligase, partial [Planctomycetota bacterium]